MARLTLGQKADRVLKLLLGLRNPRSIALLASHGFKEADLDEGWRLLRGVVKVTFDTLPPAPSDPGLVVDLDRWENTWFPIADATLQRHFPRVHARVFLNLSQTEGPAVIVSVGTFVERVQALRGSDGESQQAAELLAHRGLGDATLSEARALLEKLGKPDAAPPQVDVDAQRGETLAAEKTLWAWYLEWSRIARVAITDRRLLRELGFLKSTRGASVEEDERESDEGDDTEGLAENTAAPAEQP